MDETTPPHASGQSGAYEPRPRFRLAKYRALDLPLHKGNPLIEALPPEITKQQQATLLRREIPYEEKQRKLQPETRIKLLAAINAFRVVMPEHLELFSRITNMITLGYISRNPLNGWICQNLQTDLDLLEYEPDGLDIDPHGCTLLGCSGVGKTFVTKGILRRLPQVIEHSGYNGTVFHMLQVVWMRLDCPHDSSTKGLILNFFTELDRLLGTNYYQLYGGNRRSAVDMLPMLARVAHIHRLGLLVIDEVQNLSEAASGGQREMLNFFTSISNKTQLPIMRIGTPQALRVLSGTFRTGRRSSSMGCMHWDRMDNDVIWRRFLKALWRYQYTAMPVELSQDLIDTMHYETQGVAHLAASLYSLAQMHVIGGRETIDAKVLQEVATMSFTPIQPYLNALKTGNAAFVDMEDVSFEPLKKHIEKLKKSPTFLATPFIEIRTSKRSVPSKTSRATKGAAVLSAAGEEQARTFDPKDVGV